jgi:hypothetical protein
MSAEHEQTVEVAVTRTAFEAETIAAALREREIDARVLDGATSTTWGATMGPSTGVKVVVLAHELERAKLALEEIRVESATIDWDAVDLGSDPRVERLVHATHARRWVWTVILMLVPAGFIKLIGGVLLLAAIALGVVQMMPDRRE